MSSRTTTTCTVPAETLAWLVGEARRHHDPNRGRIVGHVAWVVPHHLALAENVLADRADDDDDAAVPSIEDPGAVAVLGDDFYVCPNTGEWVYKRAHERLVLRHSDGERIDTTGERPDA